MPGSNGRVGQPLRTSGRRALTGPASADATGRMAGRKKRQRGNLSAAFDLRNQSPKERPSSLSWFLRLLRYRCSRYSLLDLSVQPSDTPQPWNFPTPPLRKLSEADRSTPSGGSVASWNRIPPKRRPAGAAQASAHELGKAGADGPAGSTTGRISRKEKLSPVLSSSHVLDVESQHYSLSAWGKGNPSLPQRVFTVERVGKMRHAP